MIETPENHLRTLIDSVINDYSAGQPVPYQISPPPPGAEGDLATNVALVLSKKLAREPMALAQDMAQAMSESSDIKVSVAPPGFINVTFSETWRAEFLKKIFQDDSYGQGETFLNKKIVIEYTDPNPFKLFHIGHLMTNAIGESLSRLIELQSGTVRRVNYQGDVGMHVAKAIWGMRKLFSLEGVSFDELAERTLPEKMSFLGRAYAAGAASFGDDANAKNEIEEINLAVYHVANGVAYPDVPSSMTLPLTTVSDWYEKGREWSLEYFETLYQKLGTHFDEYYFESEVAEKGDLLVKDHVADQVFAESEGAIVFRGEEIGLHTRVFINSQGLPTYEAKDLGLAFMKADRGEYDLSLIVTGNEINEYFKVILAVLERISPEISSKTKHLGHGMMRLSSGKMSSRQGDVITAEALIEAAVESSEKVLQGTSTLPSIQERQEAANQMALAAIKYCILSHSVGSDIVYNETDATAITGDTGPYLQYTYARCQSVLSGQSFSGEITGNFSEEEKKLLNCLGEFPRALQQASEKLSPHNVTEYLHDLAQDFNSFYATHRILQAETEADRNRRLALTTVTSNVLKTGLWVLGIEAPERL